MSRTTRAFAGLTGLYLLCVSAAIAFASGGWAPAQGSAKAFTGGTAGAIDELVLDATNKDTFLNRQGAGIVGVGATTGAADGTLKAGTVLLGDGTAGAPSMAFSSDTDTGVYSSAANGIGFSAAGSLVLNVTSAVLEARQNLRAIDNVGFFYGSSGNTTMEFETTNNTVDTTVLGLDGTSRTLIVTEKADRDTDWAISAATNPTLRIQSADATSTSDYVSLSHDQTNAQLSVGSGSLVVDAPVLLPDGTAGAPSMAFSSDTDVGLYRISANILGVSVGGGEKVRFGTSDMTMSSHVLMVDDKVLKYGSSEDMKVSGELTTLTDGSATTVLSVVTGDGDNAGITIDYTIDMSDGTENQAQMGQVIVAIVDDAGGVVASIGDTKQQALSSGTLTTTWTVVTTDDQSIEIQCNATSSLTTTTSVVRWKATYPGNVSIVVP